MAERELEHEPPLSARERRILRGMIDSYESDRLVEAWFASRWRVAKVTLAAASACAVLAASLLEIVRSLL